MQAALWSKTCSTEVMESWEGMVLSSLVGLCNQHVLPSSPLEWRWGEGEGGTEVLL